MAEEAVEEVSGQSWSHKLADSLLKPSVITVVLAALIAPPTVEQVNQQIEQARIDAERVINQRELQSKILGQLLDYANAAGTDAQAMQKISLLTTFVKDNEESFGLVFPSVPELIAQSHQFERNKVGMEVASLKSTLAMQQEDMDKVQAEIMQAIVNLGELRNQPDDNAHQILQQEQLLEELEQRLQQERQMREAMQVSVRTRQAEIDAMDRFIAQEAQNGKQEINKLLKQLREENMDQQQLADVAEQVLQKLQQQAAQSNLTNFSYSSLGD